jgi:hypothetical protein
VLVKACTKAAIQALITVLGPMKSDYKVSVNRLTWICPANPHRFP